MMATGHAVSGASIWLAGWSWAAVADLAHPRADVLLIGTLVSAGAALYPDIDHPSSRIARCGSKLTWWVAKSHAFVGRHIHAATKLDADRRDGDGHRTITHTLVFAVLVGAVCAGLAGAYGRWATAAIVFFFTSIGVNAMVAKGKVKLRKVKLAKGLRLSRGVWYGLLLAAGAFVLVPGNTWWLGLAVGMGCVSHCLGDAITASGCPMFWPAPIPTTQVRGRRRVRVWQTWYLVGTPKWMRFRVGTPAETTVTWVLVVLGLVAVAGLVYAGAQAPTS